MQQTNKPVEGLGIGLNDSLNSLKNSKIGLKPLLKHANI